MGLQSIISYLKKKRLQNLFQMQNAKLLGLKDFNHSTTITQTSCEAESI